MNIRTSVLCVATVLCAASIGVTAGEAPAKQALEELLPKWTKAWNDKRVSALMELQHPENRMVRTYKSSAEGKAKVETGLAEIIAECGAIKSATIGKYIQRKERYVVKIEYAQKGLVPGTMSLKKDAKDTWRVLDFNLDGQGEPELEQ